MFSCGMFSALAARIAVRSRGFPSGSPPPPLAAIVISLIKRVKIFPRLASSAPFLCLIVAHLEWPDITTSEGLKMAAHPRRDLASISQPKASRLPQRATPFAMIFKDRRLSQPVFLNEPAKRAVPYVEPIAQRFICPARREIDIHLEPRILVAVVISPAPAVVVVPSID